MPQSGPTWRWCRRTARVWRGWNRESSQPRRGAIAGAPVEIAPVAPARKTAAPGRPTAGRSRSCPTAPKKEQLQLSVTPAAGGAARQLTHLKDCWRIRNGRPTGNRSRSSSPRICRAPPGRSTPSAARPAWWNRKSTSSGRAGGCGDRRRCARSRPPTCTCTNTTGRPTAAVSPPPPRTAKATTTGGLPSFTPSPRRSGEHQIHLQTAGAAATGRPALRPDGKSVVFIGGLMSDEGSTGGEIFQVPAGGGAARNLTPGLNASASCSMWPKQSRQLYFTEHYDGGSAISHAGPGHGGDRAPLAGRREHHAAVRRQRRFHVGRRRMTAP